MKIPQILNTFLKKKGPSLLAQAHFVAQADIQAVAALGIISLPYHIHQIPQKLKNRAVIQSINRTYIYSRNEISVSRNIRTPISIAELFTVAETWIKKTW